MTCEVHLLSFNESEIIGFTLRHYATYATRIILHDAFSTDATREIARSFGAEIEDWDTGGEINDALARDLKNNAWKGTDADWAIMADADELLFFPGGAAATLEAYWAAEVAVVKPHGWELCSDVFPTGSGQIYDEVKYGARADGYAKPILFAPSLVAEMNFGPGAHACDARLRDGSKLGNPMFPMVPPAYLLHCKHLGPVERVAREYASDRTRLSATNVANRWGNFDPPDKHAQDKRAGIMARLERVIA